MDKLPTPGKPYKYKSMVFWAQGGSVCMESTQLPVGHDKHFQVIHIADFRRRRNVLVRAIEKGAFAVWDERMAARKFVEDADACIREGERQGNPMDPKVLAYLMRHRSRTFTFGGIGGSSVTVAGNATTGYEDPRNADHPVPQAPPERAPVFDLTGPACPTSDN
jgi:hypothetical protein